MRKCSNLIREPFKVLLKAFFLTLFCYYTVNRRVHITEETLQHLNGAFQVEEGDGGSRDALLNGKKTYLVIDPDKPNISRRPKAVSTIEKQSRGIDFKSFIKYDL